MSSSRGGRQQIPRPRQWVAAGPAPWAALERPEPSLAVIAERLARRGPPSSLPEFPDDQLGVGPPTRQAAVLVALFERSGQPHVVLTKRTSHLSSHQGEISFPGGRLDPGETFVDAARREAFEEVGLDPATVEVIGELDHLRTVSSGALMVPVVARLDRVPVLVANPFEVDRIMLVPLVELLAPGVYRPEHWEREISAELAHLHPGHAVGDVVDWRVDFFELEDETVWGATARVLVQLLAIALDVPVPPSGR